MFVLHEEIWGAILLFKVPTQSEWPTDQQVRDRLQRAAELAARAIDQQLANWQQFRSDGITLEIAPALKITPAQRGAYELSEHIAAESAEPELAEAEQDEQVRGTGLARQTSAGQSSVESA